MAIRVNPKLIDKLERFGAEDVRLCYHCGDCSAVCAHSNEIFRFPRKSNRLLQMGLERRIETSLEPWLCYYCGQCSQQCPREAAPGETMMSLRRWLISKYDFTGIAGLFYRSAAAEIIAVILVSILAGTFFVLYGISGGSISIYDGDGAFLPSEFIHRFDIILGSILGILLVVNSIRMWYLIMVKGSPGAEPWWLYIKYIYVLPWHFFSQNRYYECENTPPARINMPWVIHLGLMLGYVTMLVLVMVYLPALQSGPSVVWPVHLFGYLATFTLVAGAAYFIGSRMRKKQEQYKRTHSTDWMFIILLSLILVTGILQHLFHRSGLPVAANATYVLHLMFVVPWLLRMPFSKWAHMVYRPLAMYFAAIRTEAVTIREKDLELTPAF